MENKQFKIRCSAIAQIMTGTIGLTEKQSQKLKALTDRHLSPGAKPLTDNMKTEMDDLIDKRENPTIPETLKSYCKQWLKEQLYGTKKRIENRYLSKGLEVEAIALEYYAEQRGLGFVLQNIESFENDFMTGTPDLILSDEVIDMKASWDCFTFPLFEDDVDLAYWMQLQGYMHLTGKRKARLVYTLQNTPEELEWDEPANYEGLPSNLRIKQYQFEYNPEFIKQVEFRVRVCRGYIKQLIEKI